MSLKLSRKSINAISILVSLAVGVCLTGLILLNLIFFYERDTTFQIIIFTALSILLSIVIFFINRSLILPYFDHFNHIKPWWFIGLMSVILVIIFFIGADHYWEMPIVHNVEICFDAEDNGGELIINSMVDPNTNRQYALESFGYSRYPFTIESGTCINGKLVNLVRREPRWWIVPRVKFIIKTSPPDGRFFISINDIPSVILFDKEADEPFNGEIIVDEGFDQGQALRIPWRKAWFFALKAGGVFLSGFYLSFFFYGLTERIFTYSSDETA